MSLYTTWRTWRIAMRRWRNPLLLIAVSVGLVVLYYTYRDSFQGDAPPFPHIKSSHSLVAKYVTEDKWKKLGGIKTKTSGFTLGQVIN